MFTLAVPLVFTAWLIGMQAVGVHRGTAPGWSRAVWLTTALLGSCTVLLLTPRLLDLLL